MNVGIILIIILLVPVLFQVIMLSSASRKRHRDVMETLERIEKRLEK